MASNIFITLQNYNNGKEKWKEKMERLLTPRKHSHQKKVLEPIVSGSNQVVYVYSIRNKAKNVTQYSTAHFLCRRVQIEILDAFWSRVLQE